MADAWRLPRNIINITMYNRVILIMIMYREYFAKYTSLSGCCRTYAQDKEAETSQSRPDVS